MTDAERLAAIFDRLGKIDRDLATHSAHMSGQRPASGRLTMTLTNSAATTTYAQAYFDGADSMPKEWTLTRIITFSAGSQTIKARAQIDAGFGSGTIICSATAPGVIWVEDMGSGGTLS